MCHAYRKHIPLQIIVGVRNSWPVKEFTPKNKWAPASSMATVLGLLHANPGTFPEKVSSNNGKSCAETWQQQTSLPYLLPPLL